MTTWHRKSLRYACCRLCLKRQGAPRWTYLTKRARKRWKP